MNLIKIVQNIQNDPILSNDKYNKILNKIGKNPLTYNYSYEKTKNLSASFDTRTKTMLVYILRKEYHIKQKDLLEVLNLNVDVYNRSIKKISAEKVFEEYLILYYDLALQYYKQFLIR